MPHLVERIGARKTRRTRTDNRHAFASKDFGNARNNFVKLKHFIDDMALVVAHRYGISVHSDRTGTFARCRTHAPRKLRKVIGKRQAFVGKLIFAAVDKVVPFRNQVM